MNSMSWPLKAPSSDLRLLISNKNCSFIDVLSNPQVRDDFRRQDYILTNYLLNHMTELTNAALAIDTYDFPAAQFVAFSFIVSSAQSFVKSISYNANFINAMHEALFHTTEFNSKMAAAFTRIFQFMLQSTPASFLSKFPDRDKIFRKLLENIKYTPFNNLLQFLTDNGDQRILAFLVENNAVKILIDLIGKDSKNDILFTNYLTNIVVSSEDDIAIFLPLIKEETLGRFLDIALHSPNESLSAASFNLLLQICSHIDDDDISASDSPLLPALEFVDKHLDELCLFIMSDKPFLEAKFHCVEFTAGISLTKDEVPEVLYKVCGYLFDQVFQNPKHTFLHRSFFTLFDSVYSDSPDIDKLVDEYNMHGRIVDAFKNKKTILASYWHYLFGIVKLIENRGSDNNEWREFLNTEYLKYTTLMNDPKQYGGSLPKEHDYFNDDDYDIEEEDDLFFEEDSPIISDESEDIEVDFEDDYISPNKDNTDQPKQINIPSLLHRLMQKDQAKQASEPNKKPEKKEEEDSDHSDEIDIDV